MEHCTARAPDLVRRGTLCWPSATLRVCLRRVGEALQEHPLGFSPSSSSSPTVCRPLRIFAIELPFGRA